MAEGEKHRLPELVVVRQLLVHDHFSVLGEIGLQLVEVEGVQLADLGAEFVHDQPLLRDVVVQVAERELPDYFLLQPDSEIFVPQNLRVDLLDLVGQFHIEMLRNARKLIDLLNEVDAQLENIVFARDLRLIELVQLFRNLQNVIDIR